MTFLVQSERFSPMAVLRNKVFPQRLTLAATAAGALALGCTGADDLSLPALLFGILVFAVAGYIKGLTAVGLPTIGVAVLSFFMPLSEAMALVALPAFVSNFWQALSGGCFFGLVRRLAPLLMPLCLTAAATVWLLGRGAPSWTLTVLACVLMAYGILGLAHLRQRVPNGREAALSPAVGVASGFLSGLVGVPIMPVLPYLQALDMKPEELVQSLGIVFSAAALAVMASLTAAGAIDLAQASLSIGAVVPTLVGMSLGQAARRRLSVEQFKTAIFVALLGIGLISLFR